MAEQERRIEADVSGGPNEAASTRCSAVWVTSPSCVGWSVRYGFRPNAVVARPDDYRCAVDYCRLTHKFDDFDRPAVFIVDHIAFNIDNTAVYIVDNPAIFSTAVFDVDDVTCHRHDAKPGATFDFICVLR